MNTEKYFCTRAAALLSVLLIFGNIVAQTPNSASHYSLHNYGIKAVGVNPANILNQAATQFEIISLLTLPQVEFLGNSNSFSIEDFNYYFGGNNVNGAIISKVLTDNDKSALINKVGKSATIESMILIDYFKFLYKTNDNKNAFALNITDKSRSRLSLPKEYFQLAFWGNEINSTYNFEIKDSFLLWYREYGFTYARDLSDLFGSTFKNFQAGFSIKLLQGFSMVDLKSVQSNLYTNQNNYISLSTKSSMVAAFSQDLGIEYSFDGEKKSTSNFSIFPSPAGTGVGFDFGISGQINDDLYFGLALADAGKINWNKNVALFENEQNIYIDSYESINAADSVIENVNKNGKYISSYPTALNSYFHFGVSYFLRDFEILFTLDYRNTFTNSFSYSNHNFLGIGASFFVQRYLPLRFALTYNGNNFGWSAGTGLKFSFFELNINSFSATNWLAPNTAKSLSLFTQTIIYF